MHLSYLPYSLQFIHPFGLSYGTRTKTDVVFVKLECDGIIGYGEASLPPYLGESHESVIEFYKKATSILNTFNLDCNPNELLAAIDALAPNNNAAKAGIDIALCDLLAKSKNQSVYDYFGLKFPEPKSTSVTISIGDLNLISQKIDEFSDFNILKIKLGHENDKKIITTIRNYSSKPMVIDVNQGWTDKYKALEMIKWLEDKNVLFVEQPMPKENITDMAWITQRSSIPTIADESFKRFTDLENIKGAFSGINIKLMKCTGLFEAVKIISEAKNSGLKINLGCMTESSCAISAAAQISSDVNWIDLDGPLLIKNNPFAGVTYNSGKVNLSNNVGIGASPIEVLNFNQSSNFISA